MWGHSSEQCSWGGSPVLRFVTGKGYETKSGVSDCDKGAGGRERGTGKSFDCILQRYHSSVD